MVIQTGSDTGQISVQLLPVITAALLVASTLLLSKVKQTGNTTEGADMPPEADSDE